MDNFYNAEYVDVNKNVSVSEIFDEGTEPDPAVYLKVLSVLVIRAGLFLAEVLSIPSTNTQVLVMHNIMDLTITSVGYGLVGYIFAFGEDFRSFIGISGLVGDDSNYDEFVQGWSILVIVSGLLTASIGDRISFVAGLVLNALVSVLTFPILFHWILSPKGWMRVMTFSGLSVSYKDYAHSSLIHMAGGYVAFLGMVVLDKRMLRFKDLDSSSIPDIGPNLALFGYFLTLVGFVGFSVPTRKYFKSHLLFNFYGIILANLIFSIVGTMMMTLVLTFACPCRDRISKWANLRFAQSGVAGVAAIAGGLDVYHPVGALIAGLFNGLIFFLESHILSKTNLEDFCNISAVHFFSGFIGTLLPPVMGTREGFNTNAYNGFIYFSWQLLCNAAILSFLGLIFFPILLLFDRCGVLRTLEEDTSHRRAISTMKTLPRVNFTRRLFDWGDADFSAPYVSDEQRDEMEYQRSEKLNILYQKKGSGSFPMSVKAPTRGSGDENVQEKDADVPKTFANYLADPKGIIPLFEEVESTSTKTSGSGMRDGRPVTPKDSKLFEAKIMRGVRNISDSKLVSRLRDSIGSSKKRRQNSESRSGFSSSSNMWVASTSSGLHVETEV